MSAQPLEHERSPQVRLDVGHILSPAEKAAVQAANSSTNPEFAYHEALLAYRVFAIRHMREELLRATVLDDTVIRRSLDTAWQLFSPIFHKATGPMIAEAYIRAFRDVQEGNVPIKLIYAMAEDHAERVGLYFHETSSDALIQGFHTYLNRQVPAKAAVERVIDAYGFTPRQMSGYTSAAQLYPQKVESSVPQKVKRQIKAYIGKSIAQRLGVFKRQEAHNLEMQAQQVAWLWMVENGKLPKNAQKMWLTAQDEKVCVQCGPMHRKKVDITGRFELPNGNLLYVPGAHVNCRCQVRLQINPFESVQKADLNASELFEFNREHPRNAAGRFVPKRQGEHPRAQRQEKPERGETQYAEPQVVDPQLAEVMRQARLERERQIMEALRPTTPTELVTPVTEVVELVTPTEVTELVSKPTELAKPTTELVRPTTELVAPVVEQPKQKVELGERTRTEMTTRPVIDPAERQRAELGIKALIDMVDADERARIEDRTTKEKVTRKYRPVMSFGQPGYALGAFYEIDSRATPDAPLGSVDLSEHEFAPMKGEDYQVSQQAMEYVDETAHEMINGIMESGAHVLRRKDPRGEARDLYSVLDDEQVYEVITAMVHHEEDWAKDQFINVEWNYEYDDQFANLTTKMSALEIGRQWDIDPSELEPVVFQLSEGYEGETLHESGSRYGGEFWRTSGRYRIVGEKKQEFVDIPVRVITLEPIVDEQIIEVIEEDVHPGEEWPYKRGMPTDFPPA